MQISINANRCEPSPMRKFHPLAVAAEQRGKKIYHLNIGQPDIATPSAYFEAVRKYDPQTLAYDASPGNPELIRAVQNYYAGLGVDREPRDILITTGGSEALLLTCLSILDPYTEVIIPEPYYPNYTTFVHAAGGVIRALPTNPWEGYRYAKRERIESLITKNTRAILITNPGNPTGVVLDREEMRMMADIAKSTTCSLSAMRSTGNSAMTKNSVCPPWPASMILMTIWSLLTPCPSGFPPAALGWAVLSPRIRSCRVPC